MTTKKQELLDAEDRSWRALSDRLDKLGAPDWERSGVNGEWSPKDLVAHIATWHAQTTDRLECLRSQGSLPEVPDVDAFNADQFEKCGKLSLHDVKVMSGASRHRFREEIAQVAEPLGERMEQIIISNAHGHYDEHLPDLDRFLTS